MRKRTIVIIISLISAFVLMSGGYGFWQKPLIITGNIKVLEPPPPPIIEVVQMNTEILDSNQPVTVGLEVPNIPEKSVRIVPVGQNGVGAVNSSDGKAEEVEPADVIETSSNPQGTDTTPIEQPINIQEENTDNTVNQEQVQVETVIDINTEEISTPITKVEVDESNEENNIDSKPEVVGENGENSENITVQNVE